MTSSSSKSIVLHLQNLILCYSLPFSRNTYFLYGWVGFLLPLFTVPFSLLLSLFASNHLSSDSIPHVLSERLQFYSKSLSVSAIPYFILVYIFLVLQGDHQSLDDIKRFKNPTWTFEINYTITITIQGQRLCLWFILRAGHVRKARHHN